LTLSPRANLALSGRRLLVAVLCLALLTPALVVGPPPEQAKANVCDVPLIGTGCEVGGWVGSKVGGGADLITDSAGVLTGGAKGLAGAIGGEVGKAVGKAIEAGTKGVFDQLTQWVGTAAGWLFLKVVTLIEDTTSPNLFQRAFIAKYQQILALAAILTVGVVSIAVLEGGRRGDVGQLVSMLVGALPMAVFGMVVGIAIVQLSLNLVDTLSRGVAEATSADIQRWFEAGAEWMVKGTTAQTTVAASSGNPAETAESAAAATAPGFVLFISALLGVIGALGLWLELLMRDAAIYVCALFMPLGLAAGIWPRWSGLLRKTFEILIVLVVSKFFIVMVVSLAASFLGNPDGVESVLAGSAMMIVALLTPFMLLKVIPFMEGALLTSGAAGTARSAVSTGSQVALMKYHMGQFGSGAKVAGSRAGGHQPFRGPGGSSPGQASGATGQATTTAAGAAASRGAPGSAGAARQSEQAAPAVSASGTAARGATPRPVSVGEESQTVAPTAPDSSPSVPGAVPRPAPAQRKQSEQQGQSGESEAPWQPSSGSELKPATDHLTNQPNRPTGGEAAEPPAPDPPKPRRLGDG